MTLTELVEKKRRSLAAKIADREAARAIITQITTAASSQNRELNDADSGRIRRAQSIITEIDTDEGMQELASLEVELQRDEAADALTREIHPGAPSPSTGQPYREHHATDDRNASRPPVAAGGFIRTSDGQPATVARGQRVADHDVVRAETARFAGRDAAVVGQHGTLGQFVRSLTTTGGSAVVPLAWSTELIELARNKAAVLQAGAQIVPMPAKQLTIARQTGDPTAAFRTEGSEITLSDPTFDNIVLEAKTMSAAVKGTMEWFQDAQDADAIVTNAISEAMALQLDKVALYGGITTGAGSINLATPPNPRGVLATLNAVLAGNVVGGATNGTAQTALAYYDEIIDLIGKVEDANEDPNALLWNSRAARQYRKAYDSTGQPLQAPAAVGDVTQYVTNQIPSYTKGTMTDRATDVFAGDWSQLLIGQRLELTIQVDTSVFIETGEIGIFAHWRGDVGVARPKAFAVYKALQGAL